VDPDTTVHVRSDRQVHRPYGLDGGGEGGASSTLLFRADGTLERMPPMFGTVLQPGDVMHHRMAGGGGFGDPLERDPLAVVRDVLDDKVSLAAARDYYGVVVDRAGELDPDATEELRRTRRRTAVGGA
jgi:N-methylhydantoinase B/oxoprolinase/acetone carboxylase alpha subunit